ncbi:MAG: SDR family NAD(P)-dependent oxidoreductase [Cyanobacteria bacterium P01_G01_bin.19]
MMKTVIITGGNSGLGYACAREIARNDNWHIILACRNSTKANRAVLRLKEETKSDRIKALNLDLADFSSIRSFATKWSDCDLPPLGALICNAGVQFVRRQTYTQNGMETTFAVNHLGHFLLVNLLLSELIPPAKIIVVSSDTHDSNKTTGMPQPYFRNPDLMAYPQEDPALKNKNVGELGRIAYTTSKLCNVLFAYELNRRLQQAKKSDIKVNVFNPGLMPGSGLAQDYTPMAKFVWHNILPILSRFIPNVNTIETAGEALAKLLLDPNLDEVSGKYFSGFKQIDSSQESYDRSLAQRLWNGSIELTSLTPEETMLNAQIGR